MENISFNGNDIEEIKLPPGFRFHPTDEELITHYLSPKALQSNFCTKAVGEVDFNKVEPWDLPSQAKIGETEFYFFCMRDRKYPTGLKTNRATDAGFWKATGKDKEIYQGENLIGMKKTLVFYQGRAPKGEKTNWVMHEYRLEGQPATLRNEWVISRIFQKSSSGKKVHISDLERTRNNEIVLYHSNLPSLMESSGYNDQSRTTNVDDHVNFFSHPTNETKPRKVMADRSNNTFLFTKSPFSDLRIPTQFTANIEMVQDQSMGRYLVPNGGTFLKTEFSMKREMNSDFGLAWSGNEMAQSSDELNFQRGPVDLDYLWNY